MMTSLVMVWQRVSCLVQQLLQPCRRWWRDASGAARTSHPLALANKFKHFSLRIVTPMHCSYGRLTAVPRTPPERCGSVSQIVYHDIGKWRGACINTNCGRHGGRSPLWTADASAHVSGECAACLVQQARATSIKSCSIAALTLTTGGTACEHLLCEGDCRDWAMSPHTHTPTWHFCTLPAC